MKLKSLLTLAIASSIAIAAQAQTVDQIGYGQMVSVQYGPFRTLASPENTGRIITYKESELSGIGIHPGAMLHSLKFYKATADSILGNAEARMILYVRNNHFTLPAAGYPIGLQVPAYTDTAFTPVDTVVYNAANNLGNEGWIGFSGFNHEYIGQDLEVYIRFEITNDNPGPEFSAQLTWMYDSTSVRYFSKSDDQYAGNFNPYFFRPNTQFGFDAATCAGNLYGGTTIANMFMNVCTGTNIELDLQNESYVSGQSTYTWETASSASGPWSTYSVPLPQPIIGLGAPSATTWYRALQTCGSASAYSTPLEVQINPGLSGVHTINSALPTGSGNYNSFTDAVAALNCGVSGPVTFNVAPGSGPYMEKVIIHEVAGTSAVNTITFNGNGNTLRQPDDTTGGIAAIKLDGADYVTVNGLTIKSVPFVSNYELLYSHGVQMTNNADYNTIKNCNIEVKPIDWYEDTAKYAAIVINGDGLLPIDGANSNCDHNTIMNNIIKGGFYSITVVGDSAGALQGNVISGNTLKGFNVYGIYAANANGLTIKNNDISRSENVNLEDFYGIYLIGQAGANITANKVHDPSTTNENSSVNATAISLLNSVAADSNRNVISNNVAYNIKSLGANAGIELSGVTGVNIYHNTLSLEYANTFCGGCMGAYGIYQHQSAANASIMNNIITIGGSGDAAQQALHFNDSIQGLALNNNNYYFSTGTSGATNVASMGGVAYATLADWQAASGAEHNSVSLDPMYANAANGDLKPTNTNLDNLGQVLSITIDINNVVRSTISTDMGAYEFGTIPEPLSVKNVGATALTVYPNPAIDVINISSPEKVKAIMLSIDGRMVMEQEDVKSIDVRALSEGTYILKLINKDGLVIKTEKVVKIR